MRKKIFFLLLFLLAAWAYGSYRQTLTPELHFEVLFFDVGQGDSALIVTPNGQRILIDGGPDKTILRLLGLEQPLGTASLDLLVLSHAHDDHVGGLTAVVDNFLIKQVIFQESSSTSPLYQSFWAAIKKRSVPVLKPNSGSIIPFDHGCYLKIVRVPDGSETNENDRSIVLIFSCLGRKVLLSGDAGQKIEQKLLQSGEDLRADVFKVSHHGSQTANSPAFLAAVNPKIAVISVGAANKYGHPASTTLAQLSSLTVYVYRTDKVGTVKILANNKDLIVSTKK
jgi:beta-lactamase superfamily II metal-dependent hydrolase